jgi:hypothetical protein
MAKPASPKYDALRLMRERNYEESMALIRADQRATDAATKKITAYKSNNVHGGTIKLSQEEAKPIIKKIKTNQKKRASNAKKTAKKRA